MSVAHKEPIGTRLREFRRDSGGDGPNPRAMVDSATGRSASASSSAQAVSNESSEALIPPLRKAAIILISLEQSLASQLLAHLDRAAVEAVTWEIARLDRVDPAEQDAVLEEFFGLGLRRLCFTFEDLDKLRDRDIRELYDPSEATLWALALASASAPTRDKVLGSLTASTERDLRQALERLGPFRLAESEAAQMEIAERFRSLSDRGAIHLPAPTGRDDLLV